mmetsp:Transcript_19071/g.48142  ORF Transcript_19071/g.48142 Transcript_19071/m.48142 type:complete len:252 (-) Transcript_19071:1120-1875(-)
MDSSPSSVMSTGPRQSFLPCPALRRGKMAENMPSWPCSRPCSTPSAPSTRDPSGMSATPPCGGGAPGWPHPRWPWGSPPMPASCCGFIASGGGRPSAMPPRTPATRTPAPNLIPPAPIPAVASRTHGGGGPGATAEVAICRCSGTGIIMGYLPPIRCWWWRPRSGACIRCPGGHAAVGGAKASSGRPAVAWCCCGGASRLAPWWPKGASSPGCGMPVGEARALDIALYISVSSWCAWKPTMPAASPPWGGG